jgi:uroporphyrinogen-III decarboxylase
LPKFAIDLIEIPDKIEAVMNIILPHLAGKSIQRAKERGYPLVWVGGWRSAPCLLSPTMWNRFVWPYIRKLVYEVVAAGLIALLHLDSDWTRELERFRELPRGKCIMALDGETDIFKAKEILGDHMCLMGDVPASMLFFKNSEDVYNYCSRLIRELGPAGFILQSGCDIPANAKLENVQAMVAAAVG